MSRFITQNPGIGGLDELTQAEEIFLTSFAGLPYSDGDVVYYNGTAMTNLGLGSAGEGLVVNAGGTAPEWSTSVTSIAIGESIGSGTSGSILFVDSSTNLAQDNANLFWDVTNTGLRTPKIIGGTATTADLTLQTTTGVGATGADMHFLTGNAGATEAMTILNNGNVGIGTTSPDKLLTLSQSADSSGLKIYGYDDKVAEIGELFINSGGDVNLKGSEEIELDSGSAKRIEFKQDGSLKMALSAAGDFSTYGNDILINAGEINYASRLSIETNASNRKGIVVRQGSGITSNLMEWQNSSGTGLGAVDYQGNVGIGTTAPGAKLQIGDNTADTSNYIIFGEREESAEGNLPFMGQFSLGGTTNDLGIGVRSSSGQIHFFTGNADAFTDANIRMSIKQDGNIGIGTTEPDYKLDVNGNVHLDTIYLDSHDAFYKTGSDNYLAFWANPTWDGAAGYLMKSDPDATDYSHSWMWKGSHKMVIDTGGNVGIGTISPISKLEVDSSGTEIVRFSSQSGNSGGEIGRGSIGLDFFNQVNNPGVLLTAIENSVSTYQSKFAISLRGSTDSAPVERFTISNTGNVQTDGTLQVDGTGDTTIAGNVGIGTTSPTRILGIGGLAARNIGMERGTVANTAGFDLTVNAGGATSAATDKAGGDLILASGVSTGTGISKISLKTAPAGASGTGDNVNVENARIDSDATAGNTRFMLYDVDNGTLERVSVGAADSGGAGFKLLRIPN